MQQRWKTLDDSDRLRLEALSRRRMRTVCEHEAPDVVNRALIKWLSIPDHKLDVARIEQVVKSESDSAVRSTQRRLTRDHRSTTDRHLTAAVRSTEGFGLLLLALLQTADAIGVEPTEFDLRVLLLLFAGYSMSAIEELVPEKTRHDIRKSRGTWQEITTAMYRDEGNA